MRNIFKRSSVKTLLPAFAFFLLAQTSGAFAAATPADVLIVPGKSVGAVSLGMTASEVQEALGKPEREQANAWFEYKDNAAPLHIFFRRGKVTEIRFQSKKYKTADGISLATYSAKKYHDDFKYDRLQYKFMNTRAHLKAGGLNIYKLNLDSTDPKSPVETLGLVYDQIPLHEAVSIADQADNGWEEWDGSQSTLWEKFKSHGPALMDNPE
ncbi:MAG TPA: hypothetical protein V6C76_09920 [Drouetiella sp.]